MTLEVLEKEDCEKLKMGCYLAVAACSEEPLKFIHLTYKPKGEIQHLCHVELFVFFFSSPRHIWQ